MHCFDFALQWQGSVKSTCSGLQVAKWVCVMAITYVAEVIFYNLLVIFPFICV
jgi:hypothetical protein